MNKTLRYRYWNRVDNTGDAIMAHISKHVLGLTPQCVQRGEDHMLGVGSILFMATRSSYVWGSGALHGQIKTPNLNPSRIFALRGPLTNQLLKERGIATRDIPFGDPGLLVSKIDYLAKLPIKYKACVVLHHSFEKKEIEKARYLSNLLKSEDVCYVSMLDSSLRPLELIMQSEIVISQGLHGLIFAEAFGKKSVWISEKNDDKWKFKFRDWLATTTRPDSEPLVMEGSPELELLLPYATRKESTVDLNKLVAALPTDCIVKEDSTDRVTFEESRKLSPLVLRYPVKFHIRKVYRAPQHERSSYQRKITDDVARKLNTWNESPYVILAEDPKVFSKEQLTALHHWMNMNSSAEFAYITQPESSTGTEPKVIDENTGPNIDGIIAIVLRPNLSYGIDFPHVQFGS